MDFDLLRDLWDTDPKSLNDSAPSVDPADLRSILDLLLTLSPGAAIGMGIFESVCRPGADIRAVWYRAVMLQLLSRQADLLSSWVRNGEFDDAVLKVAARFPIKKLHVGVVHQGFPLDVEEFVKQIREEAEGEAK